MPSWSYQASPELTDEQYACWRALLEERTGISFLQHKSILQKGLTQRMREIGVESYEQYLNKVSDSPAGWSEWIRLVDCVSVKETSFFREQYSYQLIRKYLLVRLDSYKKRQDSTLDIWSVGCSTGEEPYSLAITANEVIDFLRADIFLGLIATDISQSALSIAKKGRYLQRKIEGLAPALQRKYFKSCNDKETEVVARLKKQVCFVQENVLNIDSKPQLKMDIIFCQNVLIYFRRELQFKVLDGLVKHLKQGGILIVGPGEVIGWQHQKMQRTDDETVLSYVKL
jgi:chemotaxis protein methyltransferase CheR/type IV pilus assembly protein PilK